MSLKSRSMTGGKGMNGPVESKPSQGAVKKGWGKGGTGKGPKLRGK